MLGEEAKCAFLRQRSILRHVGPAFITAETMARAALALGKPDAALTLADLVERLTSAKGSP